MKPSSYSDPQLERILIEQKLRGRVARYGELCALASCNGDGRRQKRKVDIAGQSRAVATFGLTGACGCGDCGICRSSRVSQVACSCGAGCCSRRGVGGGEWLAFAGQKGKFPPRFPEPRPVIRHFPDRFPEPHMVPDGPFFDTHSHNFCASKMDWYNTAFTHAMGLEAVTDTEEKIGWLYQFKAAGISQMVVSGMYDNEAERHSFFDRGVDGELLDTITAFAWAQHPHFFVPFVRGFDLADPNAPAYVQSWLEAGFRGVGELIIHGHGGDYNDVQTLIDIFTVAARFEVPVQVHWEIGNVDPNSNRTAEDNFIQLQTVLDAFSKVAIQEIAAVKEGALPLKLILAHCGAGPQDVVAGYRGLVDPAAYESRLNTLLDEYPNVYFDVAGNVGFSPDLWLPNPPPGAPTDLGEFVLTKMSEQPDRFLLGLDVENRTAQRTRMYMDTFFQYASYLNWEQTLSASDKELIKHKNALKVLNLKALTIPGNFGRMSWP